MVAGLRHFLQPEQGPGQSQCQHQDQACAIDERVVRAIVCRTIRVICMALGERGLLHRTRGQDPSDREISSGFLPSGGLEDSFEYGCVWQTITSMAQPFVVTRFERLQARPCLTCL